MSELKLTVRWNENHEEARISPEDEQAILEMEGSVLALDFLKDTIGLVESLYEQSLAQHQAKFSSAPNRHGPTH
jgi:hypothetical protein